MKPGNRKRVEALEEARALSVGRPSERGEVRPDVRLELAKRVLFALPGELQGVKLLTCRFTQRGVSAAARAEGLHIPGRIGERQSIRLTASFAARGGIVGAHACSPSASCTNSLPLP